MHPFETNLLHRLIHDRVVLVEQQALGFHRLIGLAPGHDGDAVARVDEVGGCAIDDDLARAFGSRDHVGFQAGSIGDGGDENFFSVPEIGRAHEIGGNRDAAFIMNIGIGHVGSVELGFEQGSQHGRG